MSIDELDVSCLSEYGTKRAIDAWERSNGAVFGMAGYDTHTEIDLVCLNATALKQRGMYESALIEAYIGCKIDHRRHGTAFLEMLFRFGNRDNLRSRGQPLPGPGPFRIVRGVQKASKRVRGLSWTTDIDIACWYAMRGCATNRNRPSIPPPCKPTTYCVSLPKGMKTSCFADRRLPRE